jgi:hypothetical protein
VQWTPKETPLTFILAKIGVPNQPSAFSKKPWLLRMCPPSRVITVDKNPAYPVAMQELQEEKSMISIFILFFPIPLIKNDGFY